MIEKQMSVELMNYLHILFMDKKVVNQYGVLFALIIAKKTNKNPSDIIDLMNEIEKIINN